MRELLHPARTSICSLLHPPAELSLWKGLGQFLRLLIPWYLGATVLVVTANYKPICSNLCAQLPDPYLQYILLLSCRSFN